MKNYNANVFISYRRTLHDIYAGRLFDRITNRFGDETKVFMDIDAIAPGADFAEVIEKAVSSCDVLIALIGKDWLTITDNKGNCRLDNPEDFVRLEIAAALKRNIRVIPVLVQGVEMPSKDQLPDDLKSLSRRNAISIDNERWNYDADRLISAIKDILDARTVINVDPNQNKLKKFFMENRVFMVTIGLFVAIGIIIFTIYTYTFLLTGTGTPTNANAGRNSNNISGNNAIPISNANTSRNSAVGDRSVTVLNSDVILRAEPSNTSPFKSNVPKGSKIKILSSNFNNLWHKIIVLSYNVEANNPNNINPGDEGWIFYDFSDSTNAKRN